MLLGGAGDQVPLRRTGDSRRRTGHSIGAEALRTWELIEGDGAGPLRVATRQVEIPLRDIPSVEDARRALEATGDPTGTGAVQERHQLSLAERYEGKDSYCVELWSMALGDQWGLVGLPGEILCEIELQIRQRSPFANTCVVELALEAAGYMPTDMSIDQGGYEPGFTPFGRGTEAALVEGATQALQAVSGS